MLPAKDALTVCFAHVAYRLGERFAARGTGIGSFEVRTREELAARIGEADVLVISGLWRNDLVDRAPQAALHPVDQRRNRPVSARRAAARGIRLASAQGVNVRAVSEHAMALILALAPAPSRGARQPGQAASGAA